MEVTVKYDDYVVIIPVQKNNIIIQKQYKPGANMICFGFPAGFKKKNETFIGAAKRELLEETGYTAHTWTNIGKYYDNVSVSSTVFTIFIAKELTKVRSKNNPDLNESAIKNIKIPVTKLDSIIMQGACMALARELYLASY